MQKTFHDLFVEELSDILSAEEQIVKALPKVIEAALSQNLKETLRSHLQETKEQVKRLGKVFKILKIKSKVKFCKATKGLIEECSEVIKEYPKSLLRDAALISKSQRIEHYEISAYGTLCTFAKELDHKDIAHILHETLLEEEGADKKLSKIAEGGFLTTGINHEANPEIMTQAKTPISNTTHKKSGVNHTNAKKQVASKGKKDNVNQKTATKSRTKQKPENTSIIKKAAAKVSAVKKTTVKAIEKGVKKVQKGI